jgi:hypothetical protein
MKVLKSVAEADEIVRRIKGKPTEDELIQEQLNREPEEEEPEDEGYKPLPHTMDSHSSGSFVWTPVEADLSCNFWFRF